MDTNERFLKIKILILMLTIFSYPTALLSSHLFNKHQKEFGGDAVSGYQKDNKYFIYQGKNEYIEVTKAEWYYSYTTFVIFMVSVLVAAFGSFIMLLYGFIKLFKKTFLR